MIPTCKVDTQFTVLFISENKTAENNNYMTVEKHLKNATCMHKIILIKNPVDVWLKGRSVCLHLYVCVYVST